MGASLRSQPIRMLHKLEVALAGSQYEELPESIKHTLTPTQWLWLSDAEKGRLIQTETEPETYDE